jgi:glycerol kinase
LLFLNGIGGLGSPDWCSDFGSSFVGEGDSDQKLLAIVESIVISGGLSKQAVFFQLLVDLSGLSVKRWGDSEATARGAAYILAGYPKAWPPPFDLFAPEANPPLLLRYQCWSEKCLRGLGWGANPISRSLLFIYYPADIKTLNHIDAPAQHPESMFGSL